MTIRMAACLAVAAVSSLAIAAGQSTDQGTEKNLAEELAHGNVAEIELGKLAQQKASNSAVRDFGNHMVRDHTDFNNQLKEWARTTHISLPTSVTTAEADQKRKLEGLSGTAFDRAYMMDMLSDHEHDVQQLQRLAESARDSQVKQLAEKWLPKLQDHLREAENVAGQIGLSAGKGLNNSANAINK